MKLFFGRVLSLMILCTLSASLVAQSKSASTKREWRAATPAELEAILPVRAPVEKERIETEMRTATGVINARGQVIAAVVLITAGYAANGKYSYYLLAQSPLRIGSVELSFFADGKRYQQPASFLLQYRTDAGWREIPMQQRTPQSPLPNGENQAVFPSIRAQELRVVFTGPVAPRRMRLIEIKVFAP